NYCDGAAKLIPMGLKLKEATETVPEFKEILAEERGEKLIKTAKRLEGVVRHASTHACGVVITPDSLDNYAPRQYGSAGDESIVIQYEMHAVESLGLLKMDFLGLSNLTIIEQALEIIEKIHGVRIDINDIPLNDLKALKIFQQGKTTGVFQFESAGMKRYLKQLMPTDLEDIIAMVALYRPGPMEYIPDYIAGKHGKKKPQYLHEKLKPILQGTYGVAVYQEQLLQIARSLAGFSYGEADILRKAVGKKIKALLAEQEVKLIKGMIENGIEKKTAEKIWEFILPFASYGFNRSHAACYALIAYQTAFLKANYPAEFMAALLTSDQQNSDRIAIEVDECRQMGIEVMPPDINESYSTFTVVAESLESGKPRIRFGLLAVKGLGENVVKEIIKERKQNSEFNDLADFLSRVKTKDLNKRSLDAMIKSGCLDSLGERNQLLTHMDSLLSFVQEINKNTDNGQDSLFGAQGNAPSLKLSSTEPLAKRQKLTWEKEYLGLYVSEHPLSEFGEALSKKVISCGALKQCAPGSEVRVAGVVTNVKRIQTKKGDTMAFAKIEDDSGSVEILVFARTLEQNPHLWLADNIIACSGKISDKDEEVKILCDCAAVLNMDNIEEIFNQFAVRRDDWKSGKKETANKRVCLTIQEPIDYQDSINLKKLFFDYPGFFQVEILTQRLDGTRQKVRTNFKVGDHPDFLAKAKILIGEGNISLDA
ncbi:MAG: DNA polymerase III subunit alpha, partial [Patescibacteria group bacterium]